MQPMIGAKTRILQASAVLALITLLILLSLPPAAPQLAYSLYTVQSDKTETPYYVTRIHIWNSGRSAIGGDSSPVHIHLQNPPDAFYFQISDRPRPQNGFALQKPDADGNAALHFDAIAPRDGVTIAMYSYAPPAVSLDATVAGNPGLGIVPQRDPAALLRHLFAAFTALLAFACAYALLRAAVRLRREAAGLRPLPRFWPLTIRTLPDYQPRRMTRLGRFLRRHWPAAWGTLWLICWALLYA